MALGTSIMSKAVLPGIRMSNRTSIKTLAHVGMTARQPNSRPGRDRDHRRRLLFVSALISRHRRCIDRPADPHPAAGRKFGLDHASLPPRLSISYCVRAELAVADRLVWLGP